MLKVCVLKTFFINVHSLPDVDVVVGSAVTASELIWYRLSADQEDDNVVSRCQLSPCPPFITSLLKIPSVQSFRKNDDNR